MKALVALSLAVVVAVVAVPHAIGQRAAARPPGVAANSWVPINEDLGIVLVSPSPPDAKPQVQISPQALLLAPPSNGYFMVRRADHWTRLVVVEPLHGPGDAG
jgi:hypothetical protein